MSDGSSSLTLRSPEDFRRLGQVEVTQNGQPVDRLNELECVDGTVWANVWQTDLLLGIDPVTGAVTHEVDASMLPVDRSSLGSDDVLNGIAFHAESGHFFLTGKRWPTLFEVTFVPADGVPLIQP
jgi:glutaminyl-peptide cyclotransferase